MRYQPSGLCHGVYKSIFKIDVSVHVYVWVDTDKYHNCIMDLLLALIYVLVVCMGTDSYKSNLSLVLDDMLSTYDKDLRPGFGGSPVEVLTDIYLRSMGPISEKDMVYSIDIYFRQRWMDDRLALNASMENISVSIKILERIWFPDTVFYNGRKSYLHMVPTPNRFVRIGRNGSIYFSQRLTVRAICKMELHHYPLDFQTCPLHFGSFAYSDDDVYYTWHDGEDNSVTRAPDMRMSQFDLINHFAETSFTHRKQSRYSMLTVKFNLRRHTGYFVINIFVPCMLLVILSWVSFWINREATSDRIALGTTTVLTMAFLALDSRSDLPRVKYATALDLYIGLCFVFVLSAIVQFAIVHRYTKHGHGDVAPSHIDHGDDDEGESEDETVETRNGKPLDNSYRSNSDLPSNRVFLCRGESRLRVWLSSLRIKNRRLIKRHKHRNSVSQVDRISRIMFPLVFIFLNLVYWSFFLK